jgi:hypothetical protein
MVTRRVDADDEKIGHAMYGLSGYGRYVIICQIAEETQINVEGFARLGTDKLKEKMYANR